MRNIFRFSTAGATALALLLAPARAQDQSPALDADAIRMIEAAVVMPEGAAELGEYDRYYALLEIYESTFIKGVFLRRGQFEVRRSALGGAVPGVDNAYIVPHAQLPTIADGGCAVVTVFFDARTLQVVPQDYGQGPSPSACNGQS